MILGLDQITFRELKSSEKLIESLRGKLCDLDPNAFSDQELARKANVLTELLRETLLDRYQALSVRAFAHIVVALDYFLVLHEGEPDSVLDTLAGGYMDDLLRVNEVFRLLRAGHRGVSRGKSRQPQV
jgi:hypothetical protein